MDMYKIVSENPVLAIMRNIPFEYTVKYAETVVRGGISFFEIALNSEHGFEQIDILRKYFGDDVRIGAGTVITTELAKKALDCGAEFLLTPGTPVDVLEYCEQQDIQLLPGVYTPSDIATCLEHGFKTMKLFPADCLPAGYVKALTGPFDDANYVAIGGVNPQNIQEFLSNGFAGVGIASNLMPSYILKEQKWSEGEEYVQKYMDGLKKQ